MRNMSFMLTTPQFVDGSKDVTRRIGWLALKVGDLLMGAEKCQGLGPGGKMKRLGAIRVKSVRREKLEAMTLRWKYGLEECRREGFPEMNPAQFVVMFCASHKVKVGGRVRNVKPQDVVTRIEFEHLNVESELENIR